MPHNQSSIIDAVRSILESDQRFHTQGLALTEITNGMRVGPFYADLGFRLIRGNKSIQCYLEITEENAASSHLEARIEAYRQQLDRDALIIVLGAVVDLGEEGCRVLSIPISEETDADWDGRIRKITVDLKVYSPHYSDFSFKIDREDLDRLSKIQGLKDKSFTIGGRTDEIFFIGEDQTKLGTMYDILSSLSLPYDEKEATRKKPKHIIHKFDQVAFVDTDIGPVKIDSIEFDLRYSVLNNPIVVDSYKIAGFKYGFSLVRGIIENAKFIFNEMTYGGVE